LVNRHHFQLPVPNGYGDREAIAMGTVWLNRARAAHKFICSAASLDQRYGSGLSDIVRPDLVAH
jgi:hypothetical protein